MFKIHIGNCSNCNRTNTPIVVRAGFCQWCNHEKKQAKKKESGKSTAKYVYKKPNTGESELFAQKWAESNQKCEVCSEPILYPIASNFGHCLPKSLNKYPLFKLYLKNILLLCHFSGRPDGKPGCHFKLDHTPRSELKKDSRWDLVWELEAELKEEYAHFKLEMNNKK